MVPVGLMAALVVFPILATCAAATAALELGSREQPMEVREAHLHDQMRDMMADADEDDDDVEDAQRSGRFLQLSGGPSAEESAGLRDSASALNEALGSRWNGDELEEDAKRKTNVLLQGIAGHKAFG